MTVIAHPALTGFHANRGRRLARRLLEALRVWRRRVRERRALANLTERELADFGATTADVYRELATPFWRAEPPR